MGNKKTKKLSRPNKKTLGLNEGPYRGVSLTNIRLNSDNTWSYNFRSRINYKGTQLYVGSFSTPEIAAKEYNKKARSLYTEKRAKVRGMWNEM